MQTLQEIFKARLEQLRADAASNDISLSCLCREAGMSRATPDRWKVEPPNTIQLFDSLEAALKKRLKAKKN